MHAVAQAGKPAIGHNNPPSSIDAAGAAIHAVSQWMEENPVIETEEQARACKPLLDRAKAALDEMEAERDSKVRPLNEQVKKINDQYKALHNTDSKRPALYDKILNELKARLAAFMRREEEKRQAEAARLRAEAEEKERAAREAEAKEREALENAAAGELGVNVAVATDEADAAFGDFQRASRFADRAERDSKVRIGGGFGSAASLRTVETLHLDDALAAIKAIGVTDKIRDAILSSARDYRKLHGELPAGVRAETERKL